MNDDYWYNQDSQDSGGQPPRDREDQSGAEPGVSGPEGRDGPNPNPGTTAPAGGQNQGHQGTDYPPRQEPAPPASPPRYAYSYQYAYQDPSVYQKPAKAKKVRQKREKKGPGFLGIVVACLICAVLGGLIGGVTGAFWHQDAASSTASASLPSAPASPTPSFNYPSGSPGASNPPASAASSGGSLSGAQIYDQGCPETVGVTTDVTTQNIFGQPSQGSVIGSGFIVRADGYILTNYHVVEDAYQGGYPVNVILYNGDKYTAKIVGVEPDNDIAVLQIDASNLPAVTIGDSDTIAVGEPVYAIGNPLGELTYTMTTGTVSALNREISTESSDTAINMFQIDAAVNAGNSGGPVFDGTGEVVGIVTAKYSDTGVEGLGFAIPINDAMNIASSLIQNGYVPGKPNLGITVTTVDESTASYFNMVVGAFVRTVNPGSCAETAGIQPGDIITKVGDTDIASNADLVNAKNQYQAGDSAVFTVYRAGSYLQLTVTFDESIPSPAPSASAAPDAGGGHDSYIPRTD